MPSTVVDLSMVKKYSFTLSELLLIGLTDTLKSTDIYPTSLFFSSISSTTTVSIPDLNGFNIGLYKNPSLPTSI